MQEQSSRIGVRRDERSREGEARLLDRGWPGMPGLRLAGAGVSVQYARCWRHRPNASAQNRGELRLEKKGRGGKTVTVIAGLPRNHTFLTRLCQELKRACGTGGTVSDDAIELQGDLRDRVRACLRKKEFVVKG